jgi:hypothetical protein
MTFFSTLRTRWPAKLAFFLIGGAVLHFVPGVYIISLVFAALALLRYYHRATAGTATGRLASSCSDQDDSHSGFSSSR